MAASTDRALEPEQVGGIASAEDGLVLLDGPNGVAVAMTVEAAESTARSLSSAATEAKAQRSGR